MENFAAIFIFALVAIVGLLIQLSASESAIDPKNASYANPHNLREKLYSQLDKNTSYTVYVMRQSGNVERYYENVEACNVPELIVPVVRRAKIDTVAIGKTSKGLKIWRTMHNHRGRNEGKRIGGFKIVANKNLNAVTK